MSEHEDTAAVWEFARQFARTSGDSAACQCVSCRAARAVIASTETTTSPAASVKPRTQQGGSEGDE